MVMGRSDTRTLLEEIKAYLKNAEISASYFGRLAANNSNLVKRLEQGKTVTLPTAERVRAFIAERRESAQ